MDIIKMFKMCLNPKVLLALAAIAVAVAIFAPQYFVAALPLLIIAACPVMMIAMMVMMNKKGKK